MIICYLGVISTKGTYSAGTCPTGYADNGTNCSYKVEAYYDYNNGKMRYTFNAQCKGKYYSLNIDPTTGATSNPITW